MEVSVLLGNFIFSVLMPRVPTLFQLLLQAYTTLNSGMKGRRKLGDTVNQHDADSPPGSSPSILVLSFTTLSLFVTSYGLIELDSR